MPSGFETPLLGKRPSPSSGSEGGYETRRRSASTPATEVPQTEATSGPCASDIAKNMFPEFATWNTADLVSRLPLLLYLLEHERGGLTKRCFGPQLVRAARIWLDGSKYRHSVTSIGVLTFLANTHAKGFGFESEMLDRRAVFIVHSHSYGRFSDGLLEALPIGRSAGKNADGGLFLQTQSQGANVKVCTGKPDIAGRGEVSSATIKGKSVDDHAALTGRRVIR
ncbi:unnamed protein product [Ectocarpus sp. 4 AP-2014]